MVYSIKVLDVSLRDGGHRINFDFPKDSLDVILKSLEKSGIDYVEVGYRNGYLPVKKNLGAAGLCHKNFLLYCHSLLKQTQMAVMVHPQNIIKNDLQELSDCGVKLLRICVAKGQVAEACPVIDMGKDIGLEVSVNLIHLSHYTEDELKSALERIVSHQPDMIYFADSNGSLFPENIARIYNHLLPQYNLPFGFHAHDNLGLAQANALTALNAGATYIDASLAGMGKGTGNLKTEFLTAFLHAANHKKYQLQPLVEASNYLRSHLKTGHEPLEMDEFVRGISDLSTTQLKQKKECGQYQHILPD